MTQLWRQLINHSHRAQIPHAVVHILYDFNCLALVFAHDVATCHWQSTDCHSMFFSFSCESNRGFDGQIWCHDAAFGCETWCHDMRSAEDVSDGTFITLHLFHHVWVLVQDAKRWEHGVVSDLHHSDFTLNLVEWVQVVSKVVIIKIRIGTRAGIGIGSVRLTLGFWAARLRCFWARSGSCALPQAWGMSRWIWLWWL